jgi:protein-S-isoprenylcysteine O-methyltransferase Ste14/uncharacterized membrane protein (UPF0127 family)
VSVAARTHRAYDAVSGAVLADRLRVAATHWTRLKGLLGTRSLEAGEGLWIRPCRQVHMIGMRYAIDVAFLDDERRVVHAIPALAPGKISPRVPAATSVLELPIGTIARSGLAEGARVEIDGEVPRRPTVAAAGVASAVGNLLLALFYAVFVETHVEVGLQTGRWLVVLPLVLLESMMVALFLFRRRSVSISRRPFDWVVGIVGSFLPLLMRATEQLGRLALVGEPLQMIGLLIAFLGAGSLGRSLGLVAANRGLKDAGLYRYVRHPLYAGYVICGTGYVCSFPSLRNAVFAGLAMTAFYLRAVVEERFLSTDPAYRDYMRRVRWRFIPFVI